MIESTMFSKEAKIREILELCIQLNSKKDIENILLKFWDKFKECVSQSEDFCEFDFICMCVLDYIYENDTASLCAVSRSLYLYIQQMQLPWTADDRISYIKYNRNSFLQELRTITNLYTYSMCEEMLVDTVLGSILGGNLGLASFLVKFGFVDFPGELNEKGKKMTEILVNRFNGSFNHPLRNSEYGEMRTSIEPDKLLNLMRHSEIDFRKSLLTFCTIILVSEYRLYKKVENDSRLHSFNAMMKKICRMKFMCLNLFLDTTTETKVTLIDIEEFIATFINPLLNGDVGSSLIQASREILCSCLHYYNPRSLKDLARCKIRANLQTSMTFPEQINQFDIPVALKEFLLFHREEILDSLKLICVSKETQKQLKIRESLMRRLHFYENFHL